MAGERFRDENKRISEFDKEVWVECPNCSGRAIARVDNDAAHAKLSCLHCGYNKETGTGVVVAGISARLQLAADAYFQAGLWFQHPFKDEVFWAYNLLHLEYLEKYIAAGLREHKDRSHFTLIEKLPRFYHEAKNREALLKIIAKLKTRPV